MQPLSARAETSRVNDLEVRGVSRQMQSVYSLTGLIGIKYSNEINVLDRKLCVAPMMDWTD
jgi:hypothetical protein